MSTRANHLRIENLTVSFDGFKALDNLSLCVDPGELLCVIGPNGAGKTTMMNVITGKTRPDSGTVRFGNHNLLRMNEPKIVAAGIGRKFQKPSVFEQFTVTQNLEHALIAKRPFLKNLVGKITALEGERVEYVLGIIGLKDQRDRLAGSLGGHGQKQLLEIGMLLMLDSDLLLLDEPVAGVDPQDVERIAELLVSLAGRHSVVVVEHDMAFVRSIARRVIVLHEGHVLIEGNMESVQSDPQVVDVYLGNNYAVNTRP